MKPLSVSQAPYLRGRIRVPGDKSIAHRSVIISALTQGKTAISNLPLNEDCLSTLKAFKQLGVVITPDVRALRPDSLITVSAKGLAGLKAPHKPIMVGESGTTLRLIMGVLTGCDFTVRLLPGKSLSQRPMLRVTKPLRLMGAKIKALTRRGEEYAPITITGGNPKPITYKLPVASAQVKSALLLAGLFARGKTRVIEPVKTRDHTERMLKLFKAAIKLFKNEIVIKGNNELVSPGRILIPGDISSAAFFMVAASLLPGSRVVIENVSLNPSRTGIIRVLRRMGARIALKPVKAKYPGQEPRGDILVQSARLKATVVRKRETPSLIDELPVLMVAASVARGKSVFEGVQELRVKEADRIRAMSDNLGKMGGRISARLAADKSERIVIEGVQALNGARVKSFGDHRTAMSMVVAALLARGKTEIDDVSCINKSFPGFLKLLKTITPAR